MKNYKRAQAVMLPTTEKTNLFIVNKQLFNYHKPQQGDGVSVINQNLYIISDDEIKEDDWCLVGVYPHQKVKQCAELAYGQDGRTVNGYLFTDGTKHSASECKKIISATDTSLEIYDRELSVRHKEEIKTLLPQPSQQFIKKYFEAYNKDNIITDVMVERNEPVCKCNTFEEANKCYYSSGEDCTRKCVNGDFYGVNIKVGKNNTIAIKELKDNWNREEVIDLILTVLSQYKVLADTNNVSSWSTNKWIEENL